MKLKHMTTAACVAAALGASGAAQALQATGNLAVSLNLTAACSMQLTPMTFTNPGTLSADVTATTDVHMKCTTNTPYTIGFNNGTNPNGTQRRMKHASNSNFITYQLYKENTYTGQLLSESDAGTISGTGTGQNQNIPIYGKVPSQNAQVTGVYTDTVKVTVTY